jgi:hypothetical protein
VSGAAVAVGGNAGVPPGVAPHARERNATMSTTADPPAGINPGSDIIEAIY